MKQSRKNIIAGCTAALLVGLIALPAFAAPPPHAPAHGWRAKHDPTYAGYTGHRWERDYGIIDGRCNRRAVAAILGGAVGGMIGSQVGDGSGRGIAILAGTVIGAVVGAEIGRRMDDADQACIAHGLELAKDGQRIRWDAPERGLNYTLTPLGPYRDEADCRVFSLDVGGAQRSETRGVGCRKPDGSWKLRSL